MKEIVAESRGTLVSKILAGSWRPTLTHSLTISEAELDEVTPLLYGSGAAALGWWQVRQTALKSASSGEVLHQAYRLHALQSAVHEENIETVFRLLRRASIEAVLVKGWAAASLYPERCLRPYGDIDLCVQQRDYEVVARILTSPEAAGCWVDLHTGFSELSGRTTAELFARSFETPLGCESVRLLCAEDHLALLAIHLLKHGAWRPLWLCDIAAAVESLPHGFDWDRCLGQDRNRADWIACAVRLAERLLQATPKELPPAIRQYELPAWVVNCVLKHWEAPFASRQPPMSHPLPIIDQLRHPNGIWKAIRDRWPDPILATISVNGKLNDRPRWPYQLGNCLSRVTQLLVHPRGKRAPDTP